MKAIVQRKYGDWHVMTGLPYMLRVVGFAERSPDAFRYLKKGHRRGKVVITL